MFPRTNGDVPRSKTGWEDKSPRRSHGSWRSQNGKHEDFSKVEAEITCGKMLIHEEVTEPRPGDPRSVPSGVP